MQAIEATEYGGADVLSVLERERPEPRPGQVRIAVEAAGINFADIQQRRGLYPGGPEPPFVPGLEAAGTIDATGEGVDLPVGQRVVGWTSLGGYAEYAIADARSIFPIPESMSFAEGAAFPIQFLTAYNSLHEWGGLEAGERVLIHAAAGGVGTAAVQVAAEADAEVFGTASTPEKLDLATDLGVDHPINYTETDFTEVVDEKTDGEGVDLVLDGVGGEVFDDSLDALAHFGRLVTIGVASSQPTTASATELLMENQRVIGFHLGEAMRNDPSSALAAVPELTELLSSGTFEVIVGQEFPLADAVAAHEAIEDRSTTGKVVLRP